MNNKDSEREKRDRILKILKKHPEGLTVQDIARLADINRATASKYIFGLIVEGLAYQRKLGPAKLCYLKEKKK
jgi:DNA-binding IclR family transcriptional regulator